MTNPPNNSTPVIAEFFAAPIGKAYFWWSICQIAFCILAIVYTTIFAQPRSISETIVITGFYFYIILNPAKTIWTYQSKSIKFISVQIPFGTTLTAHQHPDGWVFWKYPNGDNVFSDPIDNKLAWQKTQKRPFPGHSLDA